MKNLFFLALTLTLFANAGPALSGGLRFVPMKRYEEKDGLPPRLLAFFDIDCGQRLVKSIRFEETDASGQARIYVGGLVKDDPASSCVGEKREVSSEAGRTYSGRAFRVEPIAPPGAERVLGGRSEGSGK